MTARDEAGSSPWLKVLELDELAEGRVQTVTCSAPQSESCQELADCGGLGIGLAIADDLDDALTCALEYEGFSLVELQTDAALI